MNVLLKIVKYFFLIFTLFLISLYFIALKDKIENPELKNLDWKSYIIIGLVIIVLVITNFLLFKNSYKKSKTT